MHLDDREDKQLSLKIGNIQYLPVEILSATLSLPDKPARVLAVGGDTVLEGRDPRRVIDFHTFSVKLPPDTEWSDTLLTGLTIDYRILGTDQSMNVGVVPHPPRD